MLAAAALGCALSLTAAFYIYSATPGRPSWRRNFWLGLAGLAAGSGVWATQLVAMLAHRTGTPVHYAPAPTLAALAVVLFVALSFRRAGAP